MAEEERDFAKELKNVFDALERVIKLESDLQQQFAKTEGKERIKVAEELASAAAARNVLVNKRRKILGDLNLANP